MRVCLVVLLACLLHAGNCAKFSDRLLRKKSKSFKMKKKSGDISKRQFIPATPVQYAYPFQWPTSWNIMQQYMAPQKVDSSQITKILESPSDVQASYKGVSHYDGAYVDPHPKYPPGYPVSIEVDKENGNYDEEQEDFQQDFAKTQRGHGRDGIMANLTTVYSPLADSTEEKSTSTTTTTTTTTSIPATVSTTTKKADAAAEVEPPKVNGTVCYLPRIVVTTRLVGTTVINEVKIYTNPRDENTAHSFVSSHEVSDAASKVTHEFALPPEFITEKPLSEAEMKYYNKVPVMMTSAYIEGNHPPKTGLEPTQSGQTFNPYLPTTIKHHTTSTPKPTHHHTTRHHTTPHPPTKPKTSTKDNNKKEAEKRDTTTTVTTTTPTQITTTSTTTTTTQAPAVAPVVTNILPPPVLEKRVSVEKLNHAARHRNALFDVPGGDSSSWSGYQILGPQDTRQAWVKVSKK